MGRYIWAVVALLALVVLLGSCGGSESKRDECQAMTVKAEHDVCVAELRQERADEQGEATEGKVEAASAGEEGSGDCPFTVDQVSEVFGTQLQEWWPPWLGESEFVLCNFTNNTNEEEDFANQRDLTVYTFPTPELAAKSPAAMRQELEAEAPGDVYMSEDSWGQGAFYDVTDFPPIRMANIYLPHFYIHVDAYGPTSERQMEAIAQQLGDIAAQGVEPEAEEELEEAPGGPLEYVGTIKANNEAGTTYIDRYKIGPLSYGEEAPVPAAVLEACGTESSGEAAASVFARGKIEATYSEGSLPDMIAVAEEGTVRSTSDEPEFGGVLQVASFLGGEWRCLGQEESGYEIQPGETIDIPIWFVGDLVLSNERPRLGEEEIDSLYFEPVGSLALGFPRKYIAGPGAAKCYGEQYLLLYGRSGRC